VKRTGAAFRVVKLGGAEFLNYVFFVRRTISNSTWAEIRTAYPSGIGLREIARNSRSHGRRARVYDDEHAGYFKEP
jgi:hypothetical protein